MVQSCGPCPFSATFCKGLSPPSTFGWQYFEISTVFVNGIPGAFSTHTLNHCIYVVHTYPWTSPEETGACRGKCLGILNVAGMLHEGASQTNLLLCAAFQGLTVYFGIASAASTYWTCGGARAYWFGCDSCRPKRPLERKGNTAVAQVQQRTRRRSSNVETAIKIAAFIAALHMVVALAGPGGRARHGTRRPLFVCISHHITLRTAKGLALP